MNKTKLAYRPVGLLLGAAAGMVASAASARLWRMATGGDDAPDALEEDRGWGEILLAAALTGAVFAVVKAAVDRAGAQGVRRVTGNWPG